MRIKTNFTFCFSILMIILFYNVYSAQAQVRNYTKTLQILWTKVHDAFYIPQTNYYKEFAEERDARHKIAFLWSMGALWQAENEIEKIFPEKKILKKDYSVIKKYYDAAAPAAGYDSYPNEFGKEDRYYDDNEWLGLTAMDAYFRTKDNFYLNFGKTIFRFIMTGFDTTTGGGLYWKEGDKSTKNTCSNGPGIILAMQLYKATHKQYYLDTALLLYNWMNKTLQAPDGLYYDNIKTQTKEIAQHKFSYNTGTMLQSNVYLYECTKDKKYLNEANRIAYASLRYFYADGKFKDDYWFNAVLLRAYQQLLQYNHDKKYLLAFKACVDNALQNNTNANGLMGKDKTLNLVAQGGMLEILARFAWLTNEKKLW